MLLDGETVPVQVVPPGHPDLDEDEDRADATYCFSKNLITVSGRIENSKRYFELLLHEIMHQRLHVSGLSEILSRHDKSGKLEEAICQVMANGTYELVRDNQDLCVSMKKK